MIKKQIQTITIAALAMIPMLTQAKQNPPSNRVSIEKARDVAKAAYPGKILGEELEFEGGKWIYSFDLKKAGDRSVHEVHVDAIQGILLDKHTETASEEKKELSDEKKESSKSEENEGKE